VYRAFVDYLTFIIVSACLTTLYYEPA